MSKANQIDRAKISLPLEQSSWIRALQKQHHTKTKIHLSLSQIVSLGMDLARKSLTSQLTGR